MLKLMYLEEDAFSLDFPPSVLSWLEQINMENNFLKTKAVQK